jgi:hypothetical protein
MSISAERQREILTDSRKQFEEKLYTLTLERRTEERMLTLAQAKKLKIGRYTGGDHKPAELAAKQRLMQLAYDIEKLEIAIAGVDEELAGLPETEEPETEEGEE